MADEARPLSRRERREMEEQAAAGLVPVPVASSAPSAAQDGGLDALDASGLSRRDRRRLERLEQPMETWTAVEEMHHTGQVPTMTPEVIAQQEELARRRAAEAQADALTATGEIHQVAAPLVPAPAVAAPLVPAPEVSAPEVSAPEVSAPVVSAPVVSAPEVVAPEASAAEVAAPVISRYDMPDEVPEPPRAAPSGPGDDARRRLAQAAAEAAATLPSDRERPPAPVRPEYGVIDAPRPMTAEVPSLADLTPPMGIRGAQSSYSQGAPEAPPQQGFPAQEGPYPTTGSVPVGAVPTGAVPTGAVPTAYPLGAPPAPFAGAPTSPPAGQLGPPPGQPGPPPGVAPPPAPRAAPTPSAPEARLAPALSAATGSPSAPVPVVGQVMPPPGVPQGAIGSPPPPGFGPPTGAIPTQGGPSAYPPGTALSPIVTGMLRPVPGATGTMRAIPGAGPMTGTIPRPIIDVQPAGGAKEFGWPHIALLAAAAFVLGLVVWKISGLGG